MSDPLAPTMASPLHRPSEPRDERTQRETITVAIRGAGQALNVLVLSKRAESIEIMLQEGAHNLYCELKPTADALAYAGTSLGREIVYERSRKDVEADLASRALPEGEAPAW